MRINPLRAALAHKREGTEVWLGADNTFGRGPNCRGTAGYLATGGHAAPGGARCRDASLAMNVQSRLIRKVEQAVQSVLSPPATRTCGRADLSSGVHYQYTGHAVPVIAMSRCSAPAQWTVRI